ncbi:MAG: tRNA1(Val) (adenine(37)-N6)-methyltransferase, partial [Chitinophagaceae bacterium]
IGTGTGLLSLILSQQTKARIDAIEIDREAYEQAKENIQASPFSCNIDIIHTDARFFVSQEKYDCIISNPPFYENELKSVSSKKNKAHHKEGLLLENLLSIVKDHLNPGGSFYLLFPYKRNSELKNLFAKNNLAISCQTLVRQSVNHPYFRIMLAGKHKTERIENVTNDELTIKNELNEYTPEFINLLRDYYLHL